MTNHIRYLSALHATDPGCSREEWLRVAMSAKAAGLSFDDFHAWSKAGANYAGEADCRQVWNSISADGGIKAGTLMAVATAQGWRAQAQMLSNGMQEPGPRPSNAGRVRLVSSLFHASVHTERIRAVWDTCVPAEKTHPYIAKKGGCADGLRIYAPDAPPLLIRGQSVAGYLAVPCTELDGTLQTLQFVPPEGGEKLNLPQAKFGTGCFVVGDIATSPVIFVGEGIGQAWATCSATGHAAVVCFGAGRMHTVAMSLRAAYPEKRLILVPDRGKEAQAEAVAKEVQGEWIALPPEKPSNYDVNDFMQEFGADALGEMLKRTQLPPARFKLLTGSELGSVVPLRWLVRGTLPANGLVALYGPPGSGKSFLVLDLAVSVAGGAQHWFGGRITQVPVTYVVLEGEAGMGKRLNAWSLFHKEPLPAALRFIAQPLDLLKAGDVTDLADAVRGAGGAGGLIIIDTLNRSAPGADENSATAMGQIIAAANQLQHLTGGLVLLVHHTGKDASRGLRGHSSLYAALDGAIEVSRVNNVREWRLAKCKDDADGQAYGFRLEVQTVGVNEEGEAETSCVIVPDERKAVAKVARPTGENQKIALDILTDALHDTGDFEKGGAPLGQACIRVEQAVALIAERLVCEKKRRKERAEAALNSLVKKGIYTRKDDWLWRA